MNTAQRLRAIAKRTALDGIGEELMAIADDMEAASMGEEAALLAIAESVGLIGPGSRVGDTHNAAVRFGRALTQALAPTEPDFDGSVIVGHSKHRGGWFVFEEVAEGEFTPIKGPFSSKDEADQAMRDPHAPLIQPATPEPDVPETNFGNTTEASGVRTVKVRVRLTDDFSDCLSDEAPTERKGEPVAWGWALVDNRGTTQAIRPRRQEFFGAIQEHEQFTPEEMTKMDREWAGRAPHILVTLYTSPQVLEGFALVPVDATKVMRDAGNRTLQTLATEPGMGIADRAFYVWKAMIDAARKGE